jgi:hypothetical protein
VITQLYKSLPSAGWKSAFAGMILAVLCGTTAAGFFFPSGLPAIVTSLIGLLAGALSVYLLFLIFYLVRNGLMQLPFPIVIIFFTSLTVLYFLNPLLRIPSMVFNVFIVMLVVLLAFLMTSAVLLKQPLSSLQKGIVIFGLIFSGSVISWSVYWLADKGNGDINKWDVSQTKVADEIKPLDLENPALRGRYKVKTLFYGSGKDKRRSEFGEKVNLKTSSVDASLLLPEWKGFKKKAREWYWGFGANEFPLNGRIWYPEGDGPFPLALIVHGNHSMEDYSDPGYAYLGELLASRGFILVSVDENFVNGTWSGDFVGKEMQVRGWLLLQHLKVWKDWNHQKDHSFYNRVDMDRIALIGHSRGGEAIAIADAFNDLSFYPDNSEVKFDFHFNIRSLVSIAPTDRRYFRRLKLRDVNYFTLQGGLDSDEPSFFGMRQAGRISYSKDTGYFFRAGIYTPGGNHGQFNSSWKTDASAPYLWFLNSKPLIAEKDQQEMAKVYISGFLETTLHDKKEYLPMFEHWAFAKKWLPAIPYLNRFEDNRTTILADYEEDIDLTTATSDARIKAQHLTIWRETELFYRDGKDKQDNNAVILGWNNPGASYIIDFEKEIPLSSNDQITLSFSAGDPKELKEKGDDISESKSEKEVPPDLSIVLSDSSGQESVVPLHELIDVLPRWQIQYAKSKSLSGENYGSLWEPTLADYQLPVSYFISKNPSLNVNALKRMEFRFDKTPSGVVMLDKIGYRKR